MKKLEIYTATFIEVKGKDVKTVAFAEKVGQREAKNLICSMSDYDKEEIKIVDVSKEVIEFDLDECLDKTLLQVINENVKISCFLVINADGESENQMSVIC